MANVEASHAWHPPSLAYCDLAPLQARSYTVAPGPVWQAQAGLIFCGVHGGAAPEIRRCHVMSAVPRRGWTAFGPRCARKEPSCVYAVDGVVGNVSVEIGIPGETSCGILLNPEP